MRKVFKFTIALILVLLTFTSCTMPEYRKVVEVVGETEEPNSERVLVCNVYDNDNAMKYLSDEDADVIAEFLPYDKTWEKNADEIDCISDVLIVFDEERYYYCSECGTFYYREEGGKSRTLQNEEKSALENVLKKYVDFGTFETETQSEEQTTQYQYEEQPQVINSDGKIKEMHYLDGPKVLKKVIVTGKNKPDYDIYYYGLEYVNVRTEKGTFELTYAIENGIITADDLAKLYESDLEYSEKVISYDDGGTMEYTYNGITFIKKHQFLENGFDEDLYLCVLGTGLNDLPSSDNSQKVDYLTGSEKEYSETSGNLTLSVLIPEKAEYGKPMYISAKITNNGKTDIKYTLPVCDYINHNDIEINFTGDDYYFTDVWDLGRPHPSAIREATLGAGESYEEVFIFMPGMPVTGSDYNSAKYKMYKPGEYTGTAYFGEKISVEFKTEIIK